MRVVVVHCFGGFVVGGVGVGGVAVREVRRRGIRRRRGGGGRGRGRRATGECFGEEREAGSRPGGSVFVDGGRGGEVFG